MPPPARARETRARAARRSRQAAPQARSPRRRRAARRWRALDTAKEPAGGAARECSRLERGSGVALQDERAVGAAEAERVGERDADRHLAGGVRHVVEVALR